MNSELEYSEEWLWVTNFENWYEISNFGHVRSVPRTMTYSDGRVYKQPGRILRPSVDRKGYLMVTLRKNVKSRKAPIHVLVAEAFIGPKPPGKELDHIDGNKTNNFFGNLEYVSHAENMGRAASLGLLPSGEQHYRTKLNDADIVEIRRLYLEGMTPRAIGGHFGIAHQYVSKIVSREGRRSTPNPQDLNNQEYEALRQATVSKAQAGEKNACAKLTEAQVVEIKRLYSQGTSSRALGTQFGVSKTNVLRIVNGKMWTKVNPNPGGSEASSS